MNMTKETPHATLAICCRPLVEALRRAPEARSDAALVVGFDESGAPFYRFTRLHGGQLLSAPAERLVFCPFCGHRVVGAAETRASGVAAEEFHDGETTLLAPEERLEIETLIAAARVRDSGEHAARV